MVDDQATTDPETIMRWVHEGADLAVVLNDYDPDEEPDHPAHQHIYPNRLVTVCSETGWELDVTMPEGLDDDDRAAVAADIAQTVQSWGCSFMVLMGPRDKEVTDG